MTELKIGDRVHFCAYPDQYPKGIPATIKGITEEGGKTRYKLSGEVISNCLGANIIEHKDFTGFRKAFDIITEGGYEVNHFQSEYITSNLFEYVVVKDKEVFTILVRVEQGFAELFDSNGLTIKALL